LGSARAKYRLLLDLQAAKIPPLLDLKMLYPLHAPRCGDSKLKEQFDMASKKKLAKGKKLSGTKTLNKFTLKD
jgi:hypothetical protein